MDSLHKLLKKSQESATQWRATKGIKWLLFQNIHTEVDTKARSVKSKQLLKEMRWYFQSLMHHNSPQKKKVKKYIEGWGLYLVTVSQRIQKIKLSQHTLCWEAHSNSTRVITKFNSLIPIKKGLDFLIILF